MLSTEKFSNPDYTRDGKSRAKVALGSLDTLWFNTGTRCNLSCENCYIESNPENDRLSYITTEDVQNYLSEIKDCNLATTEIGFTGGEPFLNPYFMEILERCLSNNFSCLVLTNAYRLMNRHKDKLIEINQKYPKLLTIRVSLDHYAKDGHESERGTGTFVPTLRNLQWLVQNNIQVAVAGRSLIGENLDQATSKFRILFKEFEVPIDTNNPDQFVIFPEMSAVHDVPEITTDCWKILDKSPNDIMCSNSRMIVKRRGESQAKVTACTLLAYDKEFELGSDLKNAQKTVALNHPFCAQFCVLGGASCSN